ncbi:hypothetical protein [Streptomyces sp. DH41]|uniref:hypothetical protein n=1 Tax=Streptomyces sp. DH41 TaxID=3040125 RepID=UPI0024411ECF|nr:hypothetical protein [Streptomyces sp. DH41]MDG9728442.1 hypothetical protein [Streptomyces sp. DH41]
MRRLAAVLLALVAVLGLAVAAPQPAVADGPVGTGVEWACDGAATVSPIGVVGNIISGGAVYDMCEKIGDTADEKVKEAWNEVWESVLGDVINSAADVTKWTIKKVLTVALMGPSVDLEGTGLFGKDATLAGMLTWLGLVIATAGAMWQIGKMAITGQSKHIGRAMLGWVENIILSAVGVALIALLLAAGDALTTGLVDATFKDDGKAYETIVGVMVPAAVKNPVTMLCVVTVLLLIGFIQLILVFLRQSAIPIQCLLLPVAGGGRVGGDVTRQWAPRLITSILVVIAYKPILAVIICVGFSEFGHANTLAEWLRGCATFLLAILAPGPLTRIFAPFGEAVGGGMASGGVGGALSAAGGYFKGKQDGEGKGEGGVAPMTPLEYARYVEQSMGSQNGPEGRDGSSGQGGTNGSDAQTQAARNQASRTPVPGQAAGGEGPAGQGAGGLAGGAGGQSAGAAGGGSAAGAAGGAGAAAGGAGIAIQVLDGVNNTIQDASGQIGSGGNNQ